MARRKRYGAEFKRCRILAVLTLIGGCAEDFRYLECADSDEMEQCKLATFKDHLRIFQAADLVYELRQSIDQSSAVCFNSATQSLPNGWLLAGYYEDCRLGFHGINFIDLEENQCIFAFTGTDEKRDIYVDLGVGELHFEAKADRILADVQSCLEKGLSLVFTGHSLGGAIAQYFGFQVSARASFDPHTPVQVVTFNSPGINEVLLARGSASSENEIDTILEGQFQTHYEIDHDPISDAGTHPGLVLELDQQSTDLQLNHGRDAISKAMQEALEAQNNLSNLELSGDVPIIAGTVAKVGLVTQALIEQLGKEIFDSGLSEVFSCKDTPAQAERVCVSIQRFHQD